MTGTFLLTARGPFSLAASARFLEGFAPAAHTGTAGQPLDMAFPVEGTWQTAGVRVRDHPGGAECEVVSPAAPGRELLAALRAQVARILSLERALAELRQLPGIGEFSAAPSPSPTASPSTRQPWKSNASATIGGRTAPGPRCCCAPSWKTRPTRSPASLCLIDGIMFDVPLVAVLMNADPFDVEARADGQRATSRSGSSSWRRTMRLSTQRGARSGSRVMPVVRSSSTESTMRASTRASTAPTQ